MSETSTPPRWAFLTWALVAAIALGGGFLVGYFLTQKGGATAPTVKAVPPTPSLSKQVHDTCTACHEYPSPLLFPRWAWKTEVEQAYGFIQQFKPELQAPPLDKVIDYFENRAPMELPAAKFERSHKPFRIAFEKVDSPGRVPNQKEVNVSNVQVVKLFDGDRPDLLVCDMASGLVKTMKPGDTRWRVLCDTIPHPARAEVVDLDGDGYKDLIVANLGNFLPTDELKGSVVWLRNNGDDTFTPHTLLDKVGRVADARAAEFRRKGVKDIVVAVFGWRVAGNVVLLENETTDWKHPKFTPRIIDDRHGAIHVPVTDLNGDGKPDFVCLFAQEHERVEAFINEGDGKFTKKLIHAAPDPVYGSSGIQLVDIDGDGKLDVLYTNGDVMDQPHLLKPYHGVRWLRNTGTYPYEHHLLTPMYGVHAAVAADLTGSGRKDIVAVAFLPEYAFPQRKKMQVDAVVVLEQVEPGKFVRHALESETCDHVTCAVGDLFGSGRNDIVVGNFVHGNKEPPLRFWKNLGPADSVPKSPDRRPERWWELD